MVDFESPKDYKTIRQIAHPSQLHRRHGPVSKSAIAVGGTGSVEWLVSRRLLPLTWHIREPAGLVSLAI